MSDSEPRFSVIIPTYNRPAALAACLEACAAQTLSPDDYEVIVVDDGGSADLSAIIERYHDRLALSLIRVSNIGPARARNAAAAQARGPWLAFTDDDCTPTPGWLAALSAHVESRPEAAAGGRIVNALPGNPYAAACQLITDVICSYDGQAHGQSRFFTTNNLTVPAARFLQAGGFYAYGFGEDREFCDRWISLGRPLTYVPEAVVHHAHPYNFRSFLAKNLIYGRGAFQYHLARARRNRGRLRPAPFSSLLLLRYPWAAKLGWSAVWMATLLLLAKLANAAGFVAEAARALAAREYRWSELGLPFSRRPSTFPADPQSRSASEP